MVYVNYNGRLGNNLFQLAAGLNLAFSNNTQIFAPDVYFYKFINFKPEVVNGKVEVVEYREPNFSYNKIEYVDNISLQGYFQSEKYFKENNDRVLDSLSLKKEYLDQLKQKYKFILEYETISLHVRRTDYIYLPNVHPVLPLDYYKKAIDIVSPKNKKILVFSDDINWCKNVFVGNKFIFIENNLDILDLHLMSLCSHNIIANSSFSWWGARFNKNNNKNVIAPKQWFGPHNQNYDTSDLYCDGWKVI